MIAEEEEEEGEEDEDDEPRIECDPPCSCECIMFFPECTDSAEAGVSG